MILIPSKKYSLEDLISDLHFKDVVNTFYSNSEIVNKNAIKNGNTYQISTSLEEIDSVKKQLSNIQGQSLSFSGNSEDFSFLENLLFDKICFTESFDNIKVCYGFNNKLSSSVDIDGKKINIDRKSVV